MGTSIREDKSVELEKPWLERVKTEGHTSNNDTALVLHCSEEGEETRSHDVG